jgi:hypothetical protein
MIGGIIFCLLYAIAKMIVLLGDWFSGLNKARGAFNNQTGTSRIETMAIVVYRASQIFTGLVEIFVPDPYSQPRQNNPNSPAGYSYSPPITNYSYQGSYTPNILYHGTPVRENAEDIRKYGFIIGRGNSHGTGLYLADFATAKAYAGGTGAIIKVSFNAPATQIVDHPVLIQSRDFLNWSRYHGGSDFGDNITNYSITVLKKRFIRVNQNFYVALANRTGGNERVIFEGISLVAVLDAYGNFM